MANVGLTHPSLISFVYLGRTPLFSEPQFFHLQNGNRRTQFRGLSCWIKDSQCSVWENREAAQWSLTKSECTLDVSEDLE